MLYRNPVPIVELLIALLTLITISQTQQIVWVRTFKPINIYSDISTDNRNNIIVVAFPHLRKYSPDGQIIWDREINFGDVVAKVDVDKGDSIIVGGYGSPTYNDTWVIIKYTPDGETLWKKLIGFPPDSVPHFSDIAVDKQNNILVTGYIPGTVDSKWLTYKLTSIGEIKWLRVFTSNWGPDRPVSICADDSLNVIVGGTRGIYPLPRSWFPQVYKYSTIGDSLWAIYYSDTVQHNYAVGEITVDRLGNIILPGTRLSSFLFKFDRQGNYLWRWFEDTIKHSCFRSCVTDTSSNIFTAGFRLLLPSETIEMEVKKFQPDGESLWTFLYPLGHLNVSEAFWFKIDLDQANDIIVAGNKDTFVYIFKITEHSGIIEDKTEKMNWNVISSTIIASKRNFKINLPSSITLISIYNIAGKLIKKTKTSDDKMMILNTNDIQFFPEGIYFLGINEKSKTTIKVILLE